MTNLSDEILTGTQAIAAELAENFAQTATERDERGGTPKAERDAIRDSGLLSLSIPSELGGLGANWQEVFAVTRQFARVDSSIAHVFGFHHLLLATARLFSRHEQWEPWLEQTARKKWFWGNALNALDNQTFMKTYDGWYEFSGKKSFCSGASDSEMLMVSAMDEQVSGRLVIAAVPTGRSGITLHNDWNNIGQRQTDSGSATLERVRVEHKELLLDPGPLSSPFASIRPLIAQLHFANMFLGIAEGAFEEARQYTLKDTRAWFRSNVEKAQDDPLILRQYGEFWVALDSVKLLVERAISLLDRAWAKQESLEPRERSQLALAVGSAKVAATRHGLEICARIFEVTGARATHGSLKMDRFWRNLRTQSLHDPLEYRIQELGEWALKRQAPSPSFYS